ncbi:MULTISPECIES: glycogen debranching protein GlgX [Rothia]|uniref:Glycogen debranching enzyme GlgX n=1 Tax=Rothia nasimurium TaxID=85336 RepID=A0A1Y1RPQ8_9MICC|nr:MULTISPECIES: glycogen debranching protein GlgX [Rothia]ORC18890.1 glycogen debranching enzyme GlgX [Rothia nasimurium]
MRIEVWAPGATRVWFCLFDEENYESRHELTTKDGEHWIGDIAEAHEGSRYGFRAVGDSPHFQLEKLLIDPAARQLDAPLRWDSLMAATSQGDSAQVVPKCVIPETNPGGPDPAQNRPHHFWEDLVIYEAHVKGLTKNHPAINPEIRGTYAALADPAVLEHLQTLGVNALELLPVQTFIDDEHLIQRGLVNYWGYQPVGFSALEPRYASGPAHGAQADAEFRQAVYTLHEHGIEVILDVVFNHSGEGGENGPILSMRGLNDTGYYLRNIDGTYTNDTGTGNTVAVRNPNVLRLVLDSLRHFATRYGVDGFRFDLAATLGRTENGFSNQAAFFQAVGQDPVLRSLKMIAEPWDIGLGGYQLGHFPHPWREWNDTYRDGVRQAWRGDTDTIGKLASALLGSAQRFDHSGRPATASVNFITAHDGFTMRDLVTYSQKHNEANGEGNKDGHNDNHSDNLGVEGPTDDPAIAQARERRVRALLATLILSQGVPMLLAGDEMGNTQDGNNNAYCQDNETSWLNWDLANHSLVSYVASLVALRRRLPQLRRREFLHGDQVLWWRSNGTPVESYDWHAPDFRCFQAQLGDVLLVFNTGDEIDLSLPPHPEGRDWHLEFESEPSHQQAMVAQSVRVYS